VTLDQPDIPPEAGSATNGGFWNRAAALVGVAGDADHVVQLRAVLLVLLVALIALHGLAPGSFKVDATTIGLVVVAVVVVLVPLLKSATLPGGGGVVFRDELNRLSDVASDLLSQLPDRAVDAAAVRPAAPVTPPPDAASAGDAAQAIGATPPADVPAPSGEDHDVVAQVLAEAARSPKIGLILLSSELERETNLILARKGWHGDRRMWPLALGIRQIVEHGALPSDALSAAASFTNVRNTIIHGAATPSDDEVIRAIDAGLSIYAALRAVPDERHYVVAAHVPLFSDEQCETPITDADGVIILTVGPGRQERHERVFPTTKSAFLRAGGEVAWGWNMNRWWGQAWYRDPASGEVRGAFGSAAEFIGPMIDDVLSDAG